MWAVGHSGSQGRRLVHLVLLSDQVGHDLNAGSETAPMNNALGHVYQPTSRAASPVFSFIGHYVPPRSDRIIHHHPCA